MTQNGYDVPSGFHTVTPYLIVDDATAAIDFYQQAFGAEETFRHVDGNGRVMHAEFRIGDSLLMMGEKSADFEFMKSASDLGGASINLYLYLPDADSVYQQALLCGAEVVMPLEDQFDGDRRGGVQDPFGIIWWIATATDPDAREKLTSSETGAS